MLSPNLDTFKLMISSPVNTGNRIFNADYPKMNLCTLCTFATLKIVTLQGSFCIIGGANRGDVQKSEMKVAPKNCFFFSQAPELMGF